MKNVLQKAINFIRIIIPDDTRICEDMYDNKEGRKWCAEHCSGNCVKDECIIQFLNTVNI